MRKEEFPALVRALADGDVRMVPHAGAGRGMGAVGISIESLRRWLIGNRLEVQPWMSVDLAAKKIGVKQQVAYELIARGLLSAEIRDGFRRVYLDAIKVFCETYVSLGELAASRGMTPRRLLATLPIKPVCGPTVDGARQYFYRREALASSQSNP
uniref:hypothetical protein n=1 Tax=Cupriavidus taiwanensis TaxID=164546 RepID=UPI001F119D5E|nr:hypothetical protein [Cupriavidus taiwanensis]